MANYRQNHEIEIKLRVPDVVMLRKKLKDVKARITVPRTYESNTIYDTAQKDLVRRDRLIRVRIERLASKRGTTSPEKSASAILTYKGPTQKFSGAKTLKKAERHYKIRQEVEVTVADGEQMSRILGFLGLNPAFRYEKFRTTYAVPRIPGVKLEFDETPIGLFLELEGDVSSIDKAARLLGYQKSDYIAQSYGALYFADCRARGIKPDNMLFPPTK